MTELLISQEEVDFVIAARARPAFAKFVTLVAPGLSWDDDVFASANKNKGSRSAFRVLVAGATLDAPSIATTLVPPPTSEAPPPAPPAKLEVTPVPTPLPLQESLDIVFDPSGSRRGDLKHLLSVRDKILLKGPGGLVLQEGRMADLFRQALRLDCCKFPGGAQAMLVADSIRGWLNCDASRSASVALAAARATGAGAIIVPSAELSFVMCRASWWAILAPLVALVYTVSAPGRSPAIAPDLVWYLIHEFGVETFEVSAISPSVLASLQIPEGFPSAILTDLQAPAPILRDPRHASAGRGFGEQWSAPDHSQVNVKRRCAECGDFNHWKNQCKAPEATKARWKSRKTS